MRDVAAALTFRLKHNLGEYSAAQKALYAGVIVAAMLAVLTGLSMWKPVQLGWLIFVFGGYPVARVIHFTLMSAISAFLVVHVALVLVVPETIVPMVVGEKAAPPPAEPRELEQHA